MDRKVAVIAVIMAVTAAGLLVVRSKDHSSASVTAAPPSATPPALVPDATLTAPPASLIPPGATHPAGADASNLREYETTKSPDEVLAFLQEVLKGSTLDVQRNGPVTTVKGGGWQITIQQDLSGAHPTRLTYATRLEMGDTEH